MTKQESRFFSIKRNADIYYYQQQYFSAINKYTMIFELKNLDMARYALYMIAMCYYMKEEYYQIILAFTKYSKLFDGIIEVRHLEIAKKAYIAMGKNNMAEKCDRRIMKTDNHNPRYYYNEDVVKRSLEKKTDSKPETKSSKDSGTVVFPEYSNKKSEPQYKKDERMRSETREHDKSKGKSQGSFGAKSTRIKNDNIIESRPYIKHRNKDLADS